MAASLAEVRDAAAPLLALLGIRIRSGRFTLHFDEYQVQRVETSTMHRPVRGEIAVDEQAAVSAD